MAYYVGDIPSQDLVIEPARNGEALDLSPFDSVEARLVDPAGVTVPSAGFLATIDDDQIVVEWPSESVLEDAGMYTLRLTLEGGDFREQLPPLPLVVQGHDGWHTLDSARELWNDAPDDDRDLFELLEVSRQACVAFAPKLADGVRPPTNYVRAQLLQARNQWNAAHADPAGQIGDGTFVIRPFPMDWAVKQLLRPKTVLPAV